MVILFTVLACAAIIYYWEEISQVQQYGYLGAFISGLIAGSSIPLPFPYLAFTFTLGGVLNPLLVGISSGLGAGVGGTLVYLFGRGGGTLLPKWGIFSFNLDAPSRPRVARFVDLAKRRGAIVVFLMSAMLNPTFAPMAIVMGALRFGWFKFLLWCSLGNIVKSLFIAYAGYFGLGSLLRWLGVG